MQIMYNVHFQWTKHYTVNKETEIKLDHTDSIVVNVFVVCLFSIHRRVLASLRMWIANTKLKQFTSSTVVELFVYIKKSQTR